MPDIWECVYIQDIKNIYYKYIRYKGVGLGLGWGSGGLYNYFKAAICLISASNTPPTPPHAGEGGGGRWGGGGGMGWWRGYLREGLSKLVP